MASVADFYAFIDRMAPFAWQMSFDNAGFLVGRGTREVTRVLISLDITEEVAAEAAGWGAELIVSHHPVIFHPAKAITDRDPTGRTLLLLAERGVAAICAHTNLDAAAGGVNDALAAAVGLTGIGMLQTDGVDERGRPYGVGRVGVLAGEGGLSLTEYAARVKTALRAHGVRYVDAGRPVRRVAVGGGACADMMGDAIARGCDTFITSDVKYNGFLDARALGLNLIDAGHYPTENVICPVLEKELKAAFPEVELGISTRHKEVFSYL